MKTLKNLLLTAGIFAGSFGLINNKSYGQSNSNKLQSLENLRYPDSRISYRIEPCLTPAKAAILKAINLLEEKTILDFYEVKTNENLLFTFESLNQKIEGRYLGGLGGTEDVIATERFNIIRHGRVTLKKSEDCFNTVLHEILHALGFVHSPNQNNVMYLYETKLVLENGDYTCGKDKTLGEDIPKLINKLYAMPILHQADLVLYKVTPKKENNYFSFYIEIKNLGLRKSEKSKLNLYINNKIIQTIDIYGLETNEGIGTTLKTNQLKLTDSDKLKIIIENNFGELDKKSNEKIFDGKILK